MTDVNIRAIYGLKYNPFLPNLPASALWVLPEAERFAHRVQALALQGGFALITGDPGQGKSKTLQWIAQHLSRIPDIIVGVMERPQSKPADFYRELGELSNCLIIKCYRRGYDGR